MISSPKTDVRPRLNSFNQYLMVANKGKRSLETACIFTFFFVHIFPSKKSRIIDRYYSFYMIAKHEHDDFQQLPKQNYSINLTEIMAVIDVKMAYT